MSGTLALASCLVVAIPAFAETAVVVGYQPTAPVQIVEARFGTTDLLKSARFENRASKSIIAYRIAWISRTDGEVQVSEGPWMTLPADADPGSTVDVPDQKVEAPHLHRRAARPDHPVHEKGRGLNRCQVRSNSSYLT
jgi:hypothetical protein